MTSLKTVLGAWRSARGWRATLHALLGLPLGICGCAVIAGVLAIWAAAVWSLIDGPTGAWWLIALYAVVAVAAPVPLLWCVRALSALQRLRFRAVLGVGIVAPPSVAGRWPLRPLRAGRAPAPWRQLGYHLLALVIGGAGGELVATCWLAGPLALASGGEVWSWGAAGAAVAATV